MSQDWQNYLIELNRKARAPFRGMWGRGGDVRERRGRGAYVAPAGNPWVMRTGGYESVPVYAGGGYVGGGGVPALAGYDAMAAQMQAQAQAQAQAPVGGNPWVMQTGGYGQVPWLGYVPVITKAGQAVGGGGGLGLNTLAGPTLGRALQYGQGVLGAVNRAMGAVGGRGAGGTVAAGGGGGAQRAGGGGGSWWDRFTAEHGGETPVEFYDRTGMESRGRGEGLQEALADLEWSQGFQRMYGRAPTDDDWEAWYYHSRGGNPDVEKQRAAWKEARGMSSSQYRKQYKRLLKQGDKQAARDLKKKYESTKKRRAYRRYMQGGEYGREAPGSFENEIGPPQNEIGPGGIPMPWLNPQMQGGEGMYYGGPAGFTSGTRAGEQGQLYYGGPAAIPTAGARGAYPGMSGEEAMRLARESMARYGEEDAWYGGGPAGLGNGAAQTGTYYGGPAAIPIGSEAVQTIPTGTEAVQVVPTGTEAVQAGYRAGEQGERAPLWIPPWVTWRLGG